MQATQWCDAVSSTSPSVPPSTCPLASLPPIPPSRFQDARSLALELGGGQLLDLWTQTVERYQRTVAQVKPRFLQSERSHNHNQNQGKQKMPSTSSLWDLMGPEGDGDWGLGAGGSEGALQSWGSLASLFRPQTCSTLKIGEEKGNKKEGAGGGGGGGGGASGAGGGKFLQNLLNPTKKSVSFWFGIFFIFTFHLFTHPIICLPSVSPQTPASSPLTPAHFMSSHYIHKTPPRSSPRPPACEFSILSFLLH